MRDPSKHPVSCRLCLAVLPIRDEPRGRPRLYCPREVRPCKDRQRVLDELARRSAEWGVAGRPDVIERIEQRAARLREIWAPRGTVVS